MSCSEALEVPVLDPVEPTVLIRPLVHCRQREVLDEAFARPLVEERLDLGRRAGRIVLAGEDHGVARGLGSGDRAKPDEYRLQEAETAQ